MTYKVPQVCPLCASAFLGDGRIGTMCSACSSPQSQLNSDPEAALACACDLLNTWCRESGVPECRYPFSHDTALRNAIDTLWATLSGRDSRLRAENEKLRTADIELTCARVEIDRLRAENAELRACLAAHADCAVEYDVETYIAVRVPNTLFKKTYELLGRE